MSPSLHNILGEDGEVLTIVSLLKPPEASRLAEKPLGEMTLQEAIERIYEIAGEDGRANLVLSLRRAFDDPASDAFTSDEDVAVADLSTELYRSVNDKRDARVVLRKLTVADEPEMGDEDDDDGEGGPGPIREAIHGFIEALRRLFNIAGEEGAPLTILSLLVRQQPAEGLESSGKSAGNVRPISIVPPAENPTAG